MKHGALLLILLCGLTLLPGLGRQVMERQQELRVTLTARDMIETGRWLVPHFQDEPRLKKPPAMYWIVAGFYALCDTTTSATVSRIPNVLITMFLMAAVYWAGLTFVQNGKTALMAVVLAVSAFITQRYARVAETDMAQALFVTLSCVACFKALTQERACRWWILAGVFSGLGFMIKGPASILLPLLAVAVFLVLRRIAGKPSGLRWGFLWMLPVFALIALPWYVMLEIFPSTDAIADAAVGSEMQAMIDRAGAGHPAPFYFYLLRAPIAFLPWGLLIFPAVWMFWKGRRQSDGHSFALGWFAVTLILLSALYNKQQHYILLLLPSAAVLSAALVMPWIEGQPGRMNKFVGGYFIFLLIVSTAMSVAAFVFPSVLDWLPCGPMMIAGAAFAAIAAAGWVLIANRNRRFAVVVVWAFMAAIVYMYIFILHPFHRPETIIPEFVCEAKSVLDDSEKVYFIGRKRGTVEFYANRHTIYMRDETPESLWPRMGPGSALVTVMKIRESDPAESVSVRPVLESARGEIRCRIYVK
ncbi:MAG: ArnT family glycosyltransferase [Kiritimatiellia bacterium]